MQCFRVSLNITSAELQRYYRGVASTVVATSVDGVTIQFPALRLRPFTQHCGIQGVFDLWVDEQHRLQDIQRVDE